MEMDILKKIKTRQIVLLDGGMGTELAKRGCKMGGLMNIENPSQVLAIHQDYIAAGADILITNTLTMNRIYLESHEPGIDIIEANLAGARLARQAATGGQLVMGDISSTGRFLEPYGEYTEEQFFKNFLEQAELLRLGGVDGFIIETMSDIREAACAIKACKAAAGLPVMVSISFSSADGGGYTMMGNTVEEIAAMAEENGAIAVGANCGELEPEKMAVLAKLFSQSTSLPVIIQPNAGKPVLREDGTTSFTMGAQEFAIALMRCIDNGATVIGGCCGTTPLHIRAAAEMVKKK
jgi:5-methyltetrahydrofolate--homocysteine methyltransferase